jgi:repressor LexA
MIEMKNNTLTPKQLEVYISIQEYIKKYNYPPSIRDLCQICSIKSPSVVLVHLRKIREKGFITYEDKKRRTLAIIKEIDYDSIRTD